MNRYLTANPFDASKIILCIKSGVVNQITMDCSPKNMRMMLEKATFILGGKKTIDIFGPARVDPKVPIEETVKELAELVKEGKTGGILLSEVSAESIRSASKVHPISVVEAEVSLWARDVFQNGVAETCKELGIVLLAHSPLGRGMLAGNFGNLEDVANGEFHNMFPRFQGEDFEQNLKLVKAVQGLGVKKGCTAAQLALEWLRCMSSKDNMPIIIPLAGARAEERVKENCENISLTAEEMKEIENVLASFPVAGVRYPDAAAQLLEY